NATDHPRNGACYEVEQLKVIAKDVDNDRGRVAGQNLFDSFRQESFEGKVYPWKLGQRLAQIGLRLFYLIPRQTGLEGDFELAVVSAPGILRLLGPSNSRRAGPGHARRRRCFREPFWQAGSCRVPA